MTARQKLKESLQYSTDNVDTEYDDKTGRPKRKRAGQNKTYDKSSSDDKSDRSEEDVTIEKSAKAPKTTKKRKNFELPSPPQIHLPVSIPNVYETSTQQGW